MKKTKEPSSVAVLVRIPIFRRLWAAISFSSLGDWMGLLATTTLAAYLTKSSSGVVQGAAVSGVLLTRLLPDLLLAPVAAALVDRIDRRLLAVAGDSMAGLLYLSIAISGNYTWLLIAQFLVEAVGLFSNPAKQAMWVNIVPRERLAVANQLNYVSIYGMVPVAAALFALLATIAQFFGAPAASSASHSLISGPTSTLAINIALVFDACTYFVCAFVVGISRRMIPSFVGERSAAKSIFSLIGEGISFVRKSRIMRAIYIGILGAFGAGGLTAGVAQAYVSSLGAGTAGYGILFGSVFTGLALGMLIGPKVLPTMPRRMIFTSAIGGAGLVLIVMSLLQDFVGATVAAALMGLFAGIAWITGFTMIGLEVSDQLRGRVFGFVMSSVRLTLLATLALGGVVAGAVGYHTVQIGDFSWGLSGAAVVLAIGGVIAVCVSVFAARQVGGGLAGGVMRRMMRNRRPEQLFDTSEHPGVLIAVEGAVESAVADFVGSVGAELRAAGWTVITESPDPLPAGESFESRSGALRYAAALGDLVSRIRPELDEGAVVICHGYVDLGVVRFGAQDGMGAEAVLRIATWALDGLLPDLTILINAPAGAATPDIIADEGSPNPEAGAAAAYLDRASTAPERYAVIPPLADGNGALPPEIAERIASALRQRSPKKSAIPGVG